MPKLISGFMNVKDVVRGKYPFVEAILSALPACDQFVISDGYSTDGTWDILRKLADRHPKIELVKVKWTPRPKDTGQVFASTANETREYCTGKYLLYVQANEILHEASISRFRNLPAEHPSISLFHIPFYQIWGTDIVLEESYRIRFVKNDKRIRVLGDGGYMCYERNYALKGMASALRNPLGFGSNLRKVMTPYGFDNVPFAHIVMPKPVFRYSVMFRKSYLAKLDAKAEVMGRDTEGKRREYALKSTNSRNFGQKMYEYERQIVHAYSPGFLFKPIRLGLQDHPKIMQDLLRKRIDDYYIRERLFRIT